MKRKEFLKVAGITASSLLGSCSLKPETITPLVQPEGDPDPGIAEYYPSTCRQCPAGCGIIVKTKSGRAKKIEGNPLNPINQGKLCARGQAALQNLYHPDRIKTPLLKTGNRNDNNFKSISWKEGLDILTKKLKKSGMVFMTPNLQGSEADVVREFTRVFNGNHIIYNFENDGPYRKACRDIYGYDGLPDYDIENAQFILSFGAEFLETFQSPVKYGVGFGNIRRSRPTIRGLFTYVGSRMSMTGASADTWLPAKPGSEGILALGMIKIILDKNLYKPNRMNLSFQDLAILRNLAGKFSLEIIAGETGLSKQNIISAARDFARFRPAIAMAGTHLKNYSDGLDAIRIINILNLLNGNAGRTGGVKLYSKGIINYNKQESRILNFINSAIKGKVSTLLVHGRINPVHATCKSSGFEQSLSKIPFIVSFAAIMDDTAGKADLVLPDHSDLESWDEVIPATSGNKEVTGIMQPVVRPVFDTRQFGDTLISLIKANKGSLSPLQKQADYASFLKGRIRNKVGIFDNVQFETAWKKLVQRGGIYDRFRSSGKPQGINRPDMVKISITKKKATKEKKELFRLHIFNTPLMSDGRMAELPWLQETPDPMTTAIWGSWLEINPKTAAKLNINHGDLVEVKSDFGAIQVPAVVYPPIRPDVVAIPFGQGHKNSSRYSKDRGSNPLDLIGRTKDLKGRLPLIGNTMVEIRRISSEGNLVTAGHPDGSYRGDLIQI